MRPEGELRVGLRVERGRIARVDIASSRPDIAGAMLQGRQREEVQAALPLLFSVCGRSQSVAGALAWAVAAGEPIGPETLDRCARAVSAEMIRESACRVLLEWPRWLGETADGAAIAAARGVVAGGSDAGAGARHQAVARACFEAGGATWIGQRTLREFDRWLDAGSTVAARFLRAQRDADAAGPAARHPDPALVDGESLGVEVAGSGDAEGAHRGPAGYPEWRGAPAETGAIARLRADPLIEAITRRSVTRLPARFAARVLELAQLIDGRERARLGTRRLPGGGAIAWVENARGLLTHEVQVEAGHARAYRIVAPTDWNFHPRGALFAALADTPVEVSTSVERRAREVVRSLDPCVECSIEVDHA